MRRSISSFLAINFICSLVLPPKFLKRLIKQMEIRFSLQGSLRLFPKLRTFINKEAMIVRASGGGGYDWDLFFHSLVSFFRHFKFFTLVIPQSVSTFPHIFFLLVTHICFYYSFVRSSVSQYDSLLWSGLSDFSSFLDNCP